MFSHTPAQAGGGGTVWDSVTSLRTPGPHISPGTLAAPDGGPLETGHDLTTLGDGSVYSLEVRPAGRGPLSGELAAASFMEYDGFGRLIREIPVAGLPVKLAGAGGTWSTGARLQNAP